MQHLLSRSYDAGLRRWATTLGYDAEPAICRLTGYLSRPHPGLETWDSRLHDWSIRKGEFVLDASCTIVARHLYFIGGKKKVYDRRITLKKVVCTGNCISKKKTDCQIPSLAGRSFRIEILSSGLMTEFTIRISAGMQAYIHQTTDYRAPKDFRAAIRAIASEHAWSLHRNFILEETVGRTNEAQPLADCIAQLRVNYRWIGPTAARPGQKNPPWSVPDPHITMPYNFNWSQT